MGGFAGGERWFWRGYGRVWGDVMGVGWDMGAEGGMGGLCRGRMGALGGLGGYYGGLGGIWGLEGGMGGCVGAEWGVWGG